MEPSAATVTALACLAASAALLPIRGRLAGVVGQALACAALAIAVAAVAGRLLDAVAPGGAKATDVPGLLAIVTVTAAGVALLSTRPGLPPATWYLRTGGGERAARRVLPPALVGPIVLVLAFEAGVRAGWWSGLTALTLFTVAVVVLICSLIVAGVDAVRGFDEARDAAERGQRAERRRVEALTRRSPVGIFETDAEGHMLHVNERLADMAGLAPGPVDDAAIRAAVHPDDIDVVSDAWWRAVATGGAFNAHYRYLRPDGSTCWAVGHATPVSDGAGGISSFLGTVQDVTELRRGEEALRQAEERFRYAFEHALIGKALVSPEGAWLRVNRKVCAMTGYTEDELLDMTFQDITHPEDLEADLAQVRELLAGDIEGYEMEKRYIRADGEVIWVLLSVSLVRNDLGEPLYFVSQIQDITERRRKDTELRHRADHDGLTGLVNRRRFGDDVARELARADRDRTDLALLLLDIDGLKAINDNLGHRAGDELLRHVGTTLRGRAREDDVVARIGGDEFAVLLPATDRRSARAIAEDVLAAIRAEPLEFDGVEVRPSVSIGVVIAADLAPTERALLAGADLAMYDAKSGGRDRVSELEPDVAARLIS
jgi:diguanylate cyclase (GGDEF)-like protein/PAS domain S-box-containing protein